MGRIDHTHEAEALFRRFAERHSLVFEAAAEPPIEVLWEFPEQPGLAMAVTLGLQNGDELNLGVGDFWSYFFPFADVAQKFEAILDAWMVGNARIAVCAFGRRDLQVLENGEWQTAYRAIGFPLPFRLKPSRYLTNRPSDS